MVKSQKKEQPAIEAICNMKITEQNILKGCGKKLGHWNCGENALGDKLYLCNECKKLLESYQLAQKDFKENMLMTKTNHQLGCMLECYQSVIENRIGFEKEAKQLLEIASKLK
jgi:hypothetical protein